MNGATGPPNEARKVVAETVFADVRENKGPNVELALRLGVRRWKQQRTLGKRVPALRVVKSSEGRRANVQNQIQER